MSQDPGVNNKGGLMGKMNRFMVAAACSLLLLLSWGGTTAWAANPVYVDDGYNSGTPGWGVYSFATIQNGVNAVDVGGTVTVYAGTYAEDNVLINKGMTVQGAGVGSSIIDASASVATGNVVKIDIASGNVLFDGFTIKTGVSLNGIYETSTSSGSTITISHNKIEGFGPTSTEKMNFGLIAGYGSPAALVFTYNTITNCGDNTILLERHVGPTDVSYNTFDRTAGDWSSDAYFCMNHDAADITSLQKVSHNTIDMGAGTVFEDGTRGCGITFAGAYTSTNGGFTNIEVTDNVIYNLKPYRRGIGFWNNAGGDGSAGNINAPVIARNTILGNPGATGSYGIRLLGLVTNASITDNDCDRLDYGVWVRARNGHIATGTAANGNSFTNCTSYGILSEATSPNVDGRYNWWGDATGPQHPTLNPGGLGVDVSDYVTFNPYMTGETVVSVVPATGLSKCGTTIEYTFHIDRTGAEQVRGYDFKFTVDTGVVTVANVVTDIVEGSYLKSIGGPGSTVFYAVSYGGGVYGVSCAILGGDAGATGNGDLFTVKFTTVAEGTSSIALSSLKVRDLDNNPLPATSTDGSVQVDCTLPTMDPIAEAQDQCYKVAPTFSHIGFDDDVNLDRAEYQIDDDGWNPIRVGITTASWDSVWALPGFADLSEDAHTVYFRVKDDAGNWNADTYSWAFVKDTVAPAAPTNFVALPGHNKVHLAWTNPTGDDSWEGVEIRRVGWTDYPQYGTPGDPAPSYPANPAEGDLVAQTILAGYDDATMTGRDIYYYAAFSVDCAGNYSEASSTARDRSTSYWLGDISTALVGDGLINISDLTLFSLTFAQVQGGPSWNAEADFGPTDDHYRFGIPLPDDAINFEDLMIFSMNYGKVSPAGTSGGLLALTEAVPLGDQVSFRLVPISREDGKATYAVIIENGAEVLKGFSLKVAYGAGNALEGVTASREMTGKATEHFFGLIEQESGVVEICVAALGIDAPFKYTGEVARVVVRETAEGAVQLKTVDLRDLNNNGSEVTLPGTGGETPYIPVTTALLQNHPNPFNPTTTIPFDVAVTGDVRIEIYDVSGSLVRTLVNGEKGIGRHLATWDGRDSAGNQVHTGVYFYRMTAPGYTSQAKKMLLLK